MSPRYRVTLTKEERKELEVMTRREKTHARKFIHARALLLCDAGTDGPAWNVAAALGMTSRVIDVWRNDWISIIRRNTAVG